MILVKLEEERNRSIESHQHHFEHKIQ